MTECKLSRRELYYERVKHPYSWPKEHRDCVVWKEEGRKFVQPEKADGQAGLSPLEERCFESTWIHFSQGGLVYRQNLPIIAREFKTSFQRLTAKHRKKQYVEIRIDEAQLQQSWHLSPEEVTSIRDRIVASVKKLFSVYQGQLPAGLAIEDKPPATHEPHTVVWISNNRHFQNLLKTSPALKTGWLIGSVFPNIFSLDDRIEEVQELRKRFEMPTEPLEKVLDRYLLEEGLGASNAPKGQAFWASFEHYLSPSGDEFGNPTPDEECFVLLFSLVGDKTIPPPKMLEELIKGAARTTAHELGHVFGLPHQGIGNASIMAPETVYPDFNEAEKEYLRMIFNHSR